jgi:glutathione S-transferase
MTGLSLYIGNKNYSSWSMRPWLAMRETGIAFEERLVPFDFAAGNPAFAEFSPTNRVPVLCHGDVTVWESLAIVEYLSELFPDKRLWPADRTRRARARSISCEMLSGFTALRSQCPMNMRRTPSAIELSAATRADIARIEEIWTGCLDESGGPFLFGDFSAADAMYAPVVNRFRIYRLSDNPAVLAYMDAVESLGSWREWARAGVAEPWIVEEDEV